MIDFGIVGEDSSRRRERCQSGGEVEKVERLLAADVRWAQGIGAEIESIGKRRVLRSFDFYTYSDDKKCYDYRRRIRKR